MTSKTNGAGVTLNECTLCGDCATGCNHGAKDSLDVNLLVKAWRRGAKIYTGATVLRIERDSDRERWTVLAVHTDERLRQREPEPQVELQTILHTAYDRGRYDMIVDYHGEPVPPLSADDAAWADRVLRDQNLR